jgi:hypothetical protein
MKVDIAKLFKCEHCGSVELNECEVGPMIVREIDVFDSLYNTVSYATYYVGKDSKRWWECRQCNNKLPVKTTEELIDYLQRHKSCQK